MLTATVELWPYGDQSRSKRLITICIANVGRNEDNTYDYVYTIDEPKPLFGDPIVAQGKIFRYSREAACIELLAEVCNDYVLFGGCIMNSWRLSTYDRQAIESMRNKTRN